MRKTTTTILGTAGLALIGATLFAAPANAATAEPANPRLQGPIALMDGTSSVVYGATNADGTIAATRVTGQVPSDARQFTLPPLGGRGEIRGTGADEDQCLAATSYNDHAALMKDCDSSQGQEFIWQGNKLNAVVSSNPRYLDYNATDGVAWLAGGTSGNDLRTDLLRDAGGDEDDSVAVPTVDTIDNSTGSTVIGGTGIAGATIEIRDEDGTVIGSGTVGTDGTWSVDLGKDMSQTPENLDVVQKVADKESEPVRIDAANLPIIAPAIAAGAGILALAGLGGTIIRRRRNA